MKVGIKSFGVSEAMASSDDRLQASLGATL